VPHGFLVARRHNLDDRDDTTQLMPNRDPVRSSRVDLHVVVVANPTGRHFYQCAHAVSQDVAIEFACDFHRPILMEVVKQPRR
jgi:hypothetical protein